MEQLPNMNAEITSWSPVTRAKRICHWYISSELDLLQNSPKPLRWYKARFCVGGIRRSASLGALGNTSWIPHSSFVPRGGFHRFHNGTRGLLNRTMPEEIYFTTPSKLLSTEDERNLLLKRKVTPSKRARIEKAQNVTFCGSSPMYFVVCVHPALHTSLCSMYTQMLYRSTLQTQRS